ncbi:MAG: arylsulfatase, partial [Verrucomicrobiota bacterium]
DDLGYGEVGCYGQQKIKTPNLDRLAAEGIRFTQCYSGSTVCAPSRSTLMTGQHTGHTFIRGNSKVALRPEDTTVAEVLKKAGYVSGIFGKWGLGLEDSTGTPNRKGFDEWFGYLDQTHAHNYYPDHLWRNDKRFTVQENTGGRKGVYSHDFFTKTALNFIRVYGPDVAQPERRFFLYLPYTIPHAHTKLAKDTGNGMEVPSDAPYTSESWPQVEKNKAAMITRLDADVGRILDSLKQRKLDDKTIIFFSSDNGPHKAGGNDPSFFNASGALRGMKRDLYEGGIRVPMIVRWPGVIPAGTTSDFPWAFWDFLPTAADLAGTLPSKNIDGQSVLPALLGREQKPHEFLYWEFHEGGFHQAVRMGDWKGVRHGLDKSLEVYNLKSDPGERNDVAKFNPEVVAKIESYLKSARTENPHWPGKAKE